MTAEMRKDDKAVHLHRIILKASRAQRDLAKMAERDWSAIKRNALYESRILGILWLLSLDLTISEVAKIEGVSCNRIKQLLSRGARKAAARYGLRPDSEHFL